MLDPLDLGLRRCRDELGVVALGHFGKRGHDALDIDDHGFHSSGAHRQFLLKNIARDRKSMTEKDLVGCAAYAGKIDSFRSFGFGQLDQFLILSRNDHHFRKHRFMSVNNDVHIFFRENAKVHLASKRRRRAKEDVLEFCGDHRAAPAVSQSCPRPLEHDVAVVIVHAHVRPVHHFHDFPVNSPGHNI